MRGRCGRERNEVVARKNGCAALRNEVAVGRNEVKRPSPIGLVWPFLLFFGRRFKKAFLLESLLYTFKSKMSRFRIECKG